MKIDFIETYGEPPQKWSWCFTTGEVIKTRPERVKMDTMKEEKDGYRQRKRSNEIPYR